MRLYLSSLLLVASAFLFSNCTSDSKAGDKIKLPNATPPLALDEIYDEAAVADYLFENEERAIDSAHQASRKLFLQAIDLYKNKKNHTQALPLFKQSVSLYPDPKSYNELGNLLYETGAYEESVKSYLLAVKLGYSPLADTYFKMACATASSEEYNGTAFTYLEYAFKNGFTDSSRFVNDPHLASIRHETAYRELLFANFKNAGKNENIKYELFLSGFETLNLPFEIEPRNVGNYDNKRYIGYDFSEFVEEMENVSFGRDVSNEFCYVGIAKKTDQYTALLYSSVEMMGGFLQPVHTMLVTYNPKGEPISKKVFSCQCSAEKIKSGSFDGNLITVTEQKVEWQYPFSSVSPQENKIVGYEPLEKVSYMIDEAGNINPVAGS